jgi:hypothetical protein
MGGNYNPQYPHPGGNENPPLPPSLPPSLSLSLSLFLSLFIFA